MNKIKILIRSTIVIVLLLGLAMVTYGAEPTFIIRFQHMGPAADTPIHHIPWVKYLEKATGGRVKIMLHSSCELVPDENLLPALKAGTIDACIYASIMNPSLTDLALIETSLVCGLANQQEQETFYKQRGYEDLVREDYEEYGVHYVGPIFYDPSIMLITRKPVKSLSDLKGLKISSYKSMIKPLIDYGAVQDNISTDELYFAGKTGVIDGLVWGGVPCYSYNSWNEVFPYLLDESLGNWTCNFLFNEDTWNSLPEDIQAIFELTVNWMTTHSNLLYYSDESRLRSNFISSKLSIEEHQKIVQSAEKYWDELATKNERMAKAIQMYKDYNKELNETGWNR